MMDLTTENIQAKFQWLFKAFDCVTGCIPQRVTLAFMGCLAIINAYTMRNCMSMAMIEMTYSSRNTTTTEQKFYWSQATQGMVLGSFYIGYILTHLPGGLVAEKNGGKYTLSLGILSTAFFTLITPPVVKAAGERDYPYGLVVIRILMGVGEGVTFPAINALLASWAPIHERSILGSMTFSGVQLGTVVGTLVSGLLIDATQSWSVVFYFFGCTTIVWFIFFTIMCYSDPQRHPYIREKEKEYLTREIPQINRNHNLFDLPWLMMFKNKAFWAMIIAQIGHDWGLYVMIADLPKYMADVLNFSIKQNAYLASLPYVCMFLASISLGFLSDYLLNHKILSINAARRIFSVVAGVGPGIFMVLASYAEQQKYLAVGSFCLAMLTMGAYYPSLKVNPIDLAPNYAGTLTAFANGLGSIAGIVAPPLAGFLTPNSTLAQWRLVFWITFVVLSGTVAIYAFWGSGEEQDFNKKVGHDN